MKKIILLLKVILLLTLGLGILSCEKDDKEKVDTYTNITFINNSISCSIAEIHFTSASYNEVIYLDKPLGGIFGQKNKSVTKSLKNIPTGRHSIKVCCIAGTLTIGTVNGQDVFEYGCNFSTVMYFDITEGENKTITFN